MVNNIVYFGRIIATILLICPIRPIRLISLIRLIRPIRLISIISHSRATLVPLRFFRFLCLPSVGLQTPETGLPPVPKVLMDLRDLRDPFAERECKDSVIVNNVYHRNGNFCKKSYFFRLLAS